MPINVCRKRGPARSDRKRPPISPCGRFVLTAPHLNSAGFCPLGFSPTGCLRRCQRRREYLSALPVSPACCAAHPWTRAPCCDSRRRAGLSENEILDRQESGGPKRVLSCGQHTHKKRLERDMKIKSLSRTQSEPRIIDRLWTGEQITHLEYTWFLLPKGAARCVGPAGLQGSRETVAYTKKAEPWTNGSQQERTGNRL